jgi:1-acyl-sn-glycerol-3-phosphate acyltransferase
MSELGLDYPTRWGRSYRARFFRFVFWRYLLSPILRYLSELSVEGLGNLPKNGAIYVPNHTSHLDAPLLIAALPERQKMRLVVAAAMDTFYLERRKAFLTTLIFNGIPIDRLKVNRRSSQLALELLEDGWNVLLFAEGGRTPDGNLQEFKGGAAYLAERARVPVVPVYIHEAGLLQGKRFAKAPVFKAAPVKSKHPVRVTFGEAIYYEDAENLRHFGQRIEDAVAELGRQISGDDSYGRRPPSQEED